jgi:hypothetical protein
VGHKADLLDTVRAARAQVDEIVAGYAGDLDRPFDDGEWTRKDALAHIAVWERIAARKIAGLPLNDGDDVLDGQPWDLDAFNDAMAARWRERSSAEVQAEFSAAHAAVISALEAADENACAPGGSAWQAVDEDSAGHYSRHFPITVALPGA